MVRQLPMSHPDIGHHFHEDEPVHPVETSEVQGKIHHENDVLKAMSYKPPIWMMVDTTHKKGQYGDD